MRREKLSYILAYDPRVHTHTYIALLVLCGFFFFFCCCCGKEIRELGRQAGRECSKQRRLLLQYAYRAAAAAKKGNGSS